MPATPPTNRRLIVACLAEGALAPIAWLIAWLFGLPLAEAVWPANRWGNALLLGVAATLPMIGFLAWMMRTRWPPVASLRRQAQRLVTRLIHGAPLSAVLAIAVLAGVGEELLFRGALQPLLSQWLGSPWLGVAAAGVLFGLAHPLSRAYVVVATLGGLYLGALAQFSGEILSAIVAHSLYDIFALMALRRQFTP